MIEGIHPGGQRMGPAAQVSVIIPTRDRADRLRDAVRSALAQTLEVLEVIIVDDASADHTPAVAVELAEADARVRGIRRPEPGGAPAARNMGIQAARGSVIAFLDDDCIWAPDKLETQLALLGGDRGVVYCRHAIRHGDIWVVEGEPGAATGDPVSALLRTNYIGTYSIVVRKDLLKRVGGFDETLPRLQDWDLLLRLGRETRFGFAPEILVHGFQLPGGISLDRVALEVAAGQMVDSHAPFLGQRQLAALHYGLGKYLLVDCRTAAARTHFRRAIRLDPGNPLHWAGAGATLFGPAPAGWIRGLRRRRRAARVADTVAALDPGRPRSANAPVE